MHSTIRTTPRKAGFTLMELMVGLGIVMLLLGIGMYAGKFWAEEQALHKPMDELKMFAKMAQHRAITEQLNYEIVIRPGSFELRPKQADSEANEKFIAAVDKDKGRSSGIESYTCPEEIRLAIRRFGEEKWQVPRPDHWVFEISGICEPISFRVERGERFVEATFDPLTAGVQSEESD